MKRQNLTLSEQMKRRTNEKPPPKEELDGNFGIVISTGSTLLDLAISGGRIRGGGCPGGILVEAFGPSGSGKTVLLSEMAGAVQRQGGEIRFDDPEARLNKQFASIFGLDLQPEQYTRSNTVPQVFSAIRNWEPENLKLVNGSFADSLAALSTDLEMSKDGDKMGMRRPKEFSEELRKTCRIIAERNYLVVCSNQIRINMDAGPYGQKYTTPGGESVGFYASLRLKFSKPERIKEKRMISGKEVTRVVGVEVQVEVFKSSIWKPFRTAPLTIIFDYGIDDVRQNLQFIKDFSKESVYTINDRQLDKGMEKSIRLVEEHALERELKEQVIDLWTEIESKFETDRKPKRE